MTHVDGNALAGAFSIAFGRDMTTATSVCAECGDQHPLATTHVYLRCPGMVVRCPNCTAVEVIFTDRGGHLDLYVRSVATLHLV